MPAAAATGIGYLGALFLLRTFSSDELRLMREGLGFVSVYFCRSPRQLEEQA